MGSLDSNPAKERLAGFITLAVILLSTLTLLVVTQFDWHSYKQYRLVFSLLQDAAGIRPGTPVNVGGLAYGKVLRVKTGPLLDETGNFRANTPPLSADTPNTLTRGGRPASACGFPASAASNLCCNTSGEPSGAPSASRRQSPACQPLPCPASQSRRVRGRCAK